MKFSHLLALVALSVPAFAHAANYEVDPVHSSAQFAVKHMMISTVRGEFTKLSGTAVIDDKNLAKSTVEASIDASSISTRMDKRDEHLRGQQRFVDHPRFNESFLQHVSTSPFYPLFASLDVGAQMMKGRQGEVLWDDTVRLGVELRKKMRMTARDFAGSADPAFYAFYRSLEAYRGSMTDGNGVIVLDRNDPFLQYLKNDR